MICTYCPNALQPFAYADRTPGLLVMLCPRCDYRDPELTIDNLGGFDSPLPGSDR